MFKAVESLTVISSVIAVVILVLVLRLLRKLTNSVVVGKDSVNEKQKINKLVTASHIIVILAFAIVQIFQIFSKNKTENYRMQTAFIFFGGLSDVFLSLMLWFILDEDKPQLVQLDGDRVYTVTDVIKEGRYSATSITTYEDDEDEIVDVY